MSKFDVFYEEMTVKEAEKVIDDFRSVIDELIKTEEAPSGAKGRLWRHITRGACPRKVTPIFLLCEELYENDLDILSGKAKSKAKKAKERNKLTQAQMEEDKKRLKEEQSDLYDQIAELEDGTPGEFGKIKNNYVDALVQDLRAVINKLEAMTNHSVQRNGLKSFCYKNNIEHEGYEKL